MEAFVYIWKDFLTNKVYVGYHCGSPDDNYVCSSKSMMEEYNIRPGNFKRRILFRGTKKQCIDKEKEILTSYSAATNKRFYNKSNGTGYTPRELISELSKKMWESGEFKDKMKEIQKNRWTPETRKKHGQAIKKHIDSLSEEERKSKYGDKTRGVPKKNPEAYIKGAEKRLSDPGFRKRLSEACKGKREIVTCPHCNKQGGGGNMRRYHFNNCKQA